MRRKKPTLWQLGLKPGVMVGYRNDDGAIERRTVRSEPWQLGHGEWVVKLEGRTGGVMLTRCVEISSEADNRTQPRSEGHRADGLLAPSGSRGNVEEREPFDADERGGSNDGT